MFIIITIMGNDKFGVYDNTLNVAIGIVDDENKQ